ncbi:MAG: phosphatidylglycerol lysyltransferase domain-containing protein [Treponema sp.]|nr:phosphatidylglycerol lysyltransferase domain-containing protein [Treponema sp.]
MPADQKSYPIFKKYEGDSRLQERSAVIIASWSTEFNGLYKTIDGYLCSVYFFRDSPVYFMIHRPPGNVDYSLQHIVDRLYELSRSIGLPALSIFAIEARFLAEYQSIQGYDIQIEYKEKNSAYVYRTKDLLELSGSINYYKRKRVKKFMDNPAVLICPLTKGNVHLCLDIEKQWCKAQDCGYCESFCGCEKKALEIMVALFDERIQEGLLCYYEGTPAGYIICEKRSRDVAFLYFGKGIIPDLFLYLIYTMFKRYITDAEYMEINDDMGNRGLQQFKSHLSAYEFWRKYYCVYKRAESRNI